MNDIKIVSVLGLVLGQANIEKTSSLLKLSKITLQLLKTRRKPNVVNFGEWCNGTIFACHLGGPSLNPSPGKIYIAQRFFNFNFFHFTDTGVDVFMFKI